MADEHRSPFGIAPGSVRYGTPVAEFEPMVFAGSTCHLLAPPRRLPLGLRSGLTLSTAKHDAIRRSLVRTSENAVHAKLAEFPSTHSGVQGHDQNLASYLLLDPANFLCFLVPPRASSPGIRTLRPRPLR